MKYRNNIDIRPLYFQYNVTTSFACDIISYHKLTPFIKPERIIDGITVSCKFLLNFVELVKSVKDIALDGKENIFKELEFSEKRSSEILKK